MCFKYSPKYMGLLPQFRLVALVNTLFIAALALGLDSSLFRHREALEELFRSEPEILVVIALAVVGIGGSMTIVPREHVLNMFKYDGPGATTRSSSLLSPFSTRWASCGLEEVGIKRVRIRIPSCRVGFKVACSCR